MKRFLCLIFCLIGILFVVSCNNDDNDNEGQEPVTLSAPVVSINESNTAVWEGIENASGYEYKINDGALISVGADTKKIQLAAGEVIVVRAVGDGKKYLSSEWSEARARAIQLKEPTVTTTQFGTQVLVSWEIDENASSYQYRLNSGSAVAIEQSSFLINSTDAFYIQALGDGVNYLNSEWVLIIPQK